MSKNQPNAAMIEVMKTYRFDDRPFLVFWEVTRACALSCQHCRAEAQPQRDPNELNHEEAMRLVEQLSDLKPPMLVLTGGDPMMRTDLLDIVRYATALGLHVALSPSATARLINTDFHALKNAGVMRLSLSLDGASRETHDGFRGVNGTFDRTMQAVQMAREAGIGLQINTTITKGNLHEFEAFRDLMFEIQPEMWSVFLLVPTGRAGIADMPTANEVEILFTKLAEVARSAPFSVKTTEGHHFRRILVQQQAAAEGRKGMSSPLGIRDGRGVMFISHTGEITPSGFLPMVCGNVRSRDPGDVYRNHPLFFCLRDNDVLGGKCGVCEYRGICGGSRSRAYGVSGDVFGEEPLCSYQPKSLTKIQL